MIGNNLFHAIIFKEHTTASIGSCIVHPTCKVNRIHHVLASNEITKSEGVIIVHNNFTFFIPTFSSNKGLHRMVHVNHKLNSLQHLSEQIYFQYLVS